MDFKDKNVLITGAASGLGRSLAIKLARLGAKEMLLDISEDGLKETCAAITSAGGMAVSCKVDVTRQEDIDRAREMVQQSHPAIDILIACAGILTTKGFGDTYADYEKIMAVNVNGYARTIFSFLPLLGRDAGGKQPSLKRGLVITISSMAGLVMTPNLQFYGISKAATRAMAKALRQHYWMASQPHMKVMNVNPPQFDTQLYVNSDLDAWIAKLRRQKKIPSPDTIADIVIKAARKNKEPQEVYPTALARLGAFGARWFPGLIEYSARAYYKKNQKAGPAPGS
nr:SDR family NAD(P)-dependent oxidoreductase [Candidatus Sigynarchaeota archaeon]